MPPDRTAPWRRAVEQGVAGELCDKIVSRHHDRYGIPPRLMTALARPAVLSPSQREVLRLAGDGLTMKETGERLWLSAETVKWHRRRALVKLGARNVTQACVIACRAGLLD